MKLSITFLPDDIIKYANVMNWEELFNNYMVHRNDYVYKPEIMKEFIRNIINTI